MSALVHGGKIRDNAAKRDQQSNPTDSSLMITQKKEYKCLCKSKLNNRVQTNIVFRYSTNELMCLRFTHETSLSCPYSPPH